MQNSLTLSDFTLPEVIAFVQKKHGPEALREVLRYAVGRLDLVGTHESLKKIAAELRETGLLEAAQIVDEAAEHSHHEDEIVHCTYDLKWKRWDELPCKRSCGCWVNEAGRADYPQDYWKRHTPSKLVRAIWEKRKNSPRGK
jgi:hypothetical protein